MEEHKQLIYTIYYENKWYTDGIAIPEGITCVVGSSVALQLISKHALETYGLRIFDMMQDEDAVLVWSILENTIPVNVECKYYDDMDGAITAAEALGKMSGALFQSLMNNGLTNDQALLLVKEFIMVTLGKTSNG